MKHASFGKGNVEHMEIWKTHLRHDIFGYEHFEDVKFEKEGLNNDSVEKALFKTGHFYKLEIWKL